MFCMRVGSAHWVIKAHSDTGWLLSQMQCLRDQDALIPRPRGDLPKVCAATLAALTIGGIWVSSTERLFGWVAMVLLILTLGPVLHGVCLLAEEMLHHTNTRWEIGAPVFACALHLHFVHVRKKSIWISLRVVWCDVGLFLNDKYSLEWL